MARELEVNKPVEDLFSIWEVDGFDKHAGLSSIDFTVSFWRNGEPRSPGYTLVEVGATPGTYRLYWTPDVTGYWYLEVINPVNWDVHVGEYDILDQFAYKAVGVF